MGAKIFAIFLVSILTFVIAAGAISYRTSKTVIERKVTEASEQTVVQAGKRMDLTFSVYQDLLFQIALDPEWPSIIGNMNESAAGSFEYLQARQHLNEIMNRHAFSNPAIRSVSLIETGGEMRNGPGGVRLDDKPWFAEVHPEESRVMWIAPQAQGISDDESFQSFGLVKTVKADEETFYLLLEVKLDALSSVLRDVELGSGSRIFVETPHQTVVYSELPEQIGRGSVYEDGMKTVDYASELAPWRIIGEIPTEEMVKDSRRIYLVTWLMSGCALVIAALIGYFVSRMINQPISAVSALMKRGEEGDLQVRSAARRRDEFGNLERSFDHMMKNLSLLVRETDAAAEKLMRTATELSEVSNRTAEYTQELAAATQEIAGGAQSLADESERGHEVTLSNEGKLQSVTEASREMEVSAREVRDASRQGISYVVDLQRKTSATDATSQAIAAKLVALTDSTRSLGKIVELLNQITRKTNVLSLNAGIEAARAGTAGKGFVVLADEIRGLAMQSKQSLDEVAQITASLQSEIEETVDTLSAVQPALEEQRESLQKADGIFRQVEEHMDGFFHQLAKVTASVNELADAQKVMEDAMHTISSVSRQFSASTEEVASLGNEQSRVGKRLVEPSRLLSDLSRNLQHSLSQFKY